MNRSAEPSVLRLTPRTEPAERVPVFYIGDTEYTMPKHPPATIALEYMEILAEDGDTSKAEARAQVYLFKTMLGEDGYTALKSFEGLTLEDLAQLFVIVHKHSMGALEVPKGKPASA
jgi:hypothetical protein